MASGPKVSIALSDRPVALLVLCVVGWHALVSQSTIKYIRGTRTLPLILEVTDPVHVTSYIDASFGVHKDLKSHTGCVITLGKGAIYSKSSTQKLNTISSTEAELVAVTEGAFQVFWTRNCVTFELFII